MGHDVDEEVMLEVGYSLDIKLRDKVGLEVDGPSHYLDPEHDLTHEARPNAGFLFEEIRGRSVEAKLLQRTGGGLLKDRLLRQAGWQILHVPWFEWQKARSEKSQEQYLQSLLDTVVYL
jgi:hypothetical protein